MGAVAQAVVQGVQDQVALDIADGAADQRAGDGGGGDHGALHAGILRRRRRRVADLGAVRQADGFRARSPDPAASSTARWMVFSSSRTLPLQVWRQQQALGLGRDRAIGHAIGFGIFAREVVGQGADVLGPLAQRGQAQVHDIQAIEQVFAEGAVLDRLGQVAVGGGDDADVHLDRLGAADAVDLALLDGAQQLGLQAGIHLADFVQQQGAAIGFLELADAPGDGAGEGAFLMAEQFGFQQVFREWRRS